MRSGPHHRRKKSEHQEAQAHAHIPELVKNTFLKFDADGDGLLSETGVVDAIEELLGRWGTHRVCVYVCVCMMSVCYSC